MKLPLFIRNYIHVLIERTVSPLLGLHLPRYFPLKEKIRYFCNRQEDNIDVYEFVQHYVSKKGLLVDVGANVGLTTRFLSSYTRNLGRVLAIEPELCNFNHLAANTIHRSNVDLLNCACGSYNGQTQLFLNKISGLGNSLFPVESDHVQNVQIRTLDSILESMGNPPVSLIKIDAEGADYDVLVGMESILNKHPRCCIIIEIAPANLARCGKSPSDILDFLEQHNMSLFQYDSVQRAVVLLVRAKLIDELDAVSHINILAVKQ